MHLTEFTVTISGLTREPRKFRLPLSTRDKIEEFFEQFEDDEFIPVEEAFPELFDPILGPGRVLKGMRYREELTQKQLAEKLGIRQHHLSEMENGKRPIGKEMAKKLAKALRADYRVFL